MSITLYEPCPTSNDLLTRLIAKQAAKNYQVIAQTAIDVLPTIDLRPFDPPSPYRRIRVETSNPNPERKLKQ